MEKEISNGKKADLEKVCCNNFICQERGEYGRCYLDIYRNCPIYKAHKIIIETEMKYKKSSFFNYIIG